MQSVFICSFVSATSRYRASGSSGMPCGDAHFQTSRSVWILPYLTWGGQGTSHFSLGPGDWSPAIRLGDPWVLLSTETLNKLLKLSEPQPGLWPWCAIANTAVPYIEHSVYATHSSSKLWKWTCAVFTCVSRSYDCLYFTDKGIKEYEGELT